MRGGTIRRQFACLAARAELRTHIAYTYITALSQAAAAVRRTHDPWTRPYMPNAQQDHLQRLEFIVAHATNMVVVTNRRRQVEWVNPAYTRVTGWSLDEIKGKNPKDYLHGPGTCKAAANTLGTLLGQGRRVTDFELLNYKKSGEPFWVSLNIQPVLDDAGRITQYVAIQSDITERKRAEIAAATLTRQLAEAQRLARLGSVEHDLITGVLRCSPEIYEMLEAPCDDGACSFDKLLACVHPEDAAAVSQLYQQTLARAQDFESEHRMLTRQGKLCWVHARSVLEKDTTGQPLVRRMVLQDITQRKQHELLQRDKELLQHTVQAQSEIMSRVSHELRTPLHAILGFSELLDKSAGAALAAEARECLGHIRGSAQHLLAMVGDILELTHVSSGAMRFATTAVDAHAAVLEVAAMLEALAAERGVQINVGPRGPVSHVLADAQRLRQVLINLLGNAIKYNRPQGRVDVRLSMADASDLALAVSDTGHGIAPEHLAQLFEPFVRVGSAAASSDGNGLGLAIARSLARGMGGDVVAASALGVGSTFVVCLPAAAPAADEAPSPATRPAAPAAAAERAERVAGKLLYIEDNELNRVLVEAYLKVRPGVTLSCSASGTEELAAARRLKPDLIVVDMQLPDMSGSEVLRRILGDSELQATPCVAFSADAIEADIQAATAAGFSAYLVKPASQRDFLGMVDRFLAQGGKR
jgi:PAS domain S-box-containing protein